MKNHATNLLFLLSAALYGSIPVAYLFTGDGNASSTSTLVLLILCISPIPILLGPGMSGKIPGILRDFRLLGFSAGNSLALLASLYLMFKALEGGNPGIATVLVEVWPVFQVFILAFLLKTKSEMRVMDMILIGFFAVIGIGFLTHDGYEINIIPVLFALGSAFMMAISTSMKAVGVLRIRDEHGIGAVQATFLLTLLGVPAILVIALPQALSGGLQGASWSAAMTVAGLTMASSIAATFGTYLMKNVNSFLIFLMTPVFGLIFLSILKGEGVGPTGLYGVAILLCVNALAMLPKKKSV